MTICLATNNAHKVAELQQLLGADFTLKTLKDVGFTDEIEETATTFEGNSRLKARTVYNAIGIPTIADDSGLEVDVLDGAPGVYSARYAGEHGNHPKNNAKLLETLRDTANRSAQFRSVITLIHDDQEKQFEGIVRGEITTAATGTDGFGYDPLFKPVGYDRTFAQMDIDEKNAISHRGQAVNLLINYLKNLPQKNDSID